MEPTLELQGAIVQRLRTYAPLTLLVGERVYDDVPTRDGLPAAEYPYVSIGTAISISDDADCIFADEITLQIDAWSNDVGMPEVKRIAHEIKSAFRGYDMALSENALVLFRHERTDFLKEEAVKHASIRFAAVIEVP